MIPDQWYAVLESSEVPKNKAIGVTRMAEKLVFFRDQMGNPVCLKDKCAHRGAALSKGKILDGKIQCPFHGLRYDSTGKCTIIPANGKNTPVPERYRVKSYPARDEHGLIWIWWGETRKDYPEINFPEELDQGFSYGTLRDHWNTHYSRAIENQLDVVHLPFVHYNTIGRGNKTLVNGPKTEIQNNIIRVWVQNEVDKRQKPIRPEDIQDSNKSALLHFYFPNVWQNKISDKTRVFVAFSPIDHENTMMYIRLYQKVATLPIIREIFNWISKYGNRVIAHQDRRVVQTQRPKASSLKMDEKLIQGDLPIILYRRRRKELIDEAR